MLNYCFIRVSGYMLVSVMVFFSRFGFSVRNVMSGYCVGAMGSCPFNKVSFLSYFPSLTVSKTATTKTATYHVAALTCRRFGFFAVLASRLVPKRRQIQNGDNRT